MKNLMECIMVCYGERIFIYVMDLEREVKVGLVRCVDGVNRTSPLRT
jgi:hypothetical protein